MKPPFEKFIVSQLEDKANYFQVHVADMSGLAEVVARAEAGNKPEPNYIPLMVAKRILFIEKAIQEKLDREKGDL